MKYILFLFFFGYSSFSCFGKCNYPNDLDSAGRRCGGRAASVRPGGCLGGDGRYTDSQCRDRIYGTGNDPYDRDYNKDNHQNKNNLNNSLRCL